MGLYTLIARDSKTRRRTFTVGIKPADKGFDGPWIPERLIYRCNLESIQRRYGLSVQEKVIEICHSMDEHGLEDWRLVSNKGWGIFIQWHFMVFNPDFSSKPILTGFYRRNLKPLDDKALKIIETNSHLIISEESRELIESYVEDRVSRTFWITNDVRRSERSMDPSLKRSQIGVWIWNIGLTVINGIKLENIQNLILKKILIIFITIKQCCLLHIWVSLSKFFYRRSIRVQPEINKNEFDWAL